MEPSMFVARNLIRPWTLYLFGRRSAVVVGSLPMHRVHVTLRVCGYISDMPFEPVCWNSLDATRLLVFLDFFFTIEKKKKKKNRTHTECKIFVLRAFCCYCCCCRCRCRFCCFSCSGRYASTVRWIALWCPVATTAAASSALSGSSCAPCVGSRSRSASELSPCDRVFFCFF